MGRVLRGIRRLTERRRDACERERHERDQQRDHERDDGRDSRTKARAALRALRRGLGRRERQV
jgi:hypothetical protein